MRDLSSLQCGKRDLLKFGVAAAAIAPFAVRAHPSVYPTGTTVYDPAKAHNQYVLFGGADEKTHLIDMNGNELRRWDYPGQPSKMLDPDLIGGKRGHVIMQTENTQSALGPGTVAGPPGTRPAPGNAGRAPGNAGPPPGARPAPGNAGGPPVNGGAGEEQTGLVQGVLVPANKTLGEVDWNGNIVWTFGEKAPDGMARQHHDFERLANGNTLVLSNARHPIPGFSNPNPTSDAIYEVSPSGDVVWSWDMSDHLDELGFTPEEMALVRANQGADYFHTNSMRTLGANRWYRAGDKRFAPDNIIISSRNANFVAIIEKASGKFVWQIGPTYEIFESRGPLPVDIDQLVGQHDAHIIPEGLAGAGNILIFDNQGEAGYPPAKMKLNSGSRVIEIDPVAKKIVWQYSASASGSPDWTFYSAFISNARRLPNGNTFINEGANGRFFQVTPDGEIVWEYVSPYFDVGPRGRLGMVTANWVYRAQPVPYDWAPEGTPRSETPVTPPALANFRV